MKKLLAIIILLVLGTAIVGCDVEFGVKKRGAGISSGEIVDESLNMDNVENIKIELGVSETKIYYYSGDVIKIDGTLGNFSNGITAENKGSEVYIIEKTNSSIGITDEDTSKLEIKIPETYKEKMELTLGVGNCDVTGIKVGDMKIKSGVGNLRMKESSFNNLDLTCGVGQVDIKTNDKTGNIRVDGGVGNVDIQLKEIGGDLVYKGGLGNTDIKIPVDAPVKINTTSGLGKITLDAKTSSEGTYEFDVTMGMGNLDITN